MTQTWKSLPPTRCRLALTLETISYVATNDQSMLLSRKSTLALDLIQPRSRLDYLPPRESLTTSTQDNPKKTKQVPSTSTNTQFQAAVHSKPAQSGNKHNIQCARFPTSTSNEAAKTTQDDNKQGSNYQKLPICL